MLAKAADLFGGEPQPDEPTVDLKALPAKIGQISAHDGPHAFAKLFERST
ncbi:hypothetical protein [Rhizobacter fulvus]